VLKCWSVLFLENILPDFDDVIRPNSEDVIVECSVVDGAHGHTVWNDGFAAFGIFLDVSSIQQYLMPQMAECACGSISKEDPAPKQALMQSAADHHLGILTPSKEIHRMRDEVAPLLSHVLVNRYYELVIPWFLRYEPHREDGFEYSRCETPKPNEGTTLNHRLSQGDIVVSEWV